MARDAAKLATLDFEDLKAVMYERLHGIQTLGPPLDARGDIPPYRWLVDLYRQGSDGLRDRMSAAASDFLSEIADLDAWDVRAREELINLVAHAGLATDALRHMIDNETALRIPHLGQAVHAAMLRCAIMADMKFTPAFWLEHSAKIEDGSVIFSGLVLHGLDVALEHLHEYCTSEDTAFYIADQIPGLVEKYGAEIIGPAFRTCLPKLSAPLRRKFEEMLELSAVPLETDAAGAVTIKPESQRRDELLKELYSSCRNREVSTNWSSEQLERKISDDLVSAPGRFSGGVPALASVRC